MAGDTRILEKIEKFRQNLIFYTYLHTLYMVAKEIVLRPPPYLYGGESAKKRKKAQACRIILKSVKRLF